MTVREQIKVNLDNPTLRIVELETENAELKRDLADTIQDREALRAEGQRSLDEVNRLRAALDEIARECLYCREDARAALKGRP